MLDALITQFDKLVDQFSWRRLGFVIGAAVIVFCCLFVYESYTQHFRLERISKEIDLLDRLLAQQADIVTNSSPDITNIHKGLVQQLGIEANPTSQFYWGWSVKFMAAVLPWALLVLFFYAGPLKVERSTIYGVLVVAVPACLIGAVLPTFAYTWINYWAYPWGIFILIITIMRKLGNKANQQPTNQPPK